MLQLMKTGSISRRQSTSHHSLAR